MKTIIQQVTTEGRAKIIVPRGSIVGFDGETQAIGLPKSSMLQLNPGMKFVVHVRERYIEVYVVQRTRKKK